MPDINTTPMTIALYLLGFVLVAAIFMKTRQTLRMHRKKAGFAMSKWHLLFILLCVAAVFFLLSTIGGSQLRHSAEGLMSDTFGSHRLWRVAVLLFFAAVSGGVVFTLWRYKRILKYDIGRRLDSTNHWLQISILVTIAAAIILTICIFRISPESFLPFSLFAVVLTWLFQDAVLGVVAYIHLRSNHLLYIGDLIHLPDKNISGFVSDISLISVTIDSLDNTRVNIPISSLQKGAFVNLRELLEGNTSGRRMLRTFTIDSRSIREVSRSDMQRIASALDSRGEDTIAVTTEMKKASAQTPMLNLYLYRRYLRHWLCNNYEVARSPRMIVSLEAPGPEGVPLKVYIYIKQTQLETYEHIAAEITEHILQSMSWFGLRLYQRPTGNDLRNQSSKTTSDDGNDHLLQQ